MDTRPRKIVTLYSLVIYTNIGCTKHRQNRNNFRQTPFVDFVTVLKNKTETYISNTIKFIIKYFKNVLIQD